MFPQHVQVWLAMCVVIAAFALSGNLSNGFVFQHLGHIAIPSGKSSNGFGIVAMCAMFPPIDQVGRLTCTAF